MSIIETYFEVDIHRLAGAILALRERLGLTQEAMAREMDAPVYSYVRWEKGRAEPGGTKLIKMMRLCPDENSLAAFGLVAGAPTQSRHDGYYKLREDLETVIASGQSPLINKVEEVLDRIAEDARYMTRKNRSTVVRNNEKDNPTPAIESRDRGAMLSVTVKEAPGGPLRKSLPRDTRRALGLVSPQKRG